MQMDISHTPKIRTNRVFQIMTVMQNPGAKWITGNEKFNTVTLVKLTKKLESRLIQSNPFRDERRTRGDTQIATNLVVAKITLRAKIVNALHTIT